MRNRTGILEMETCISLLYYKFFSKVYAHIIVTFVVILSRLTSRPAFQERVPLTGNTFRRPLTRPVF